MDPVDPEHCNQFCIIFLLEVVEGRTYSDNTDDACLIQCKFCLKSPSTASPTISRRRTVCSHRSTARRPSLEEPTTGRPLQPVPFTTPVLTSPIRSNISGKMLKDPFSCRTSHLQKKVLNLNFFARRHFGFPESMSSFRIGTRSDRPASCGFILIWIRNIGGRRVPYQ